MESVPRAETRSGRPYQLRLTPIACGPHFSLAPLLKRAVDDEDAHAPDICIPPPLLTEPAPAFNSAPATAFLNSRALNAKQTPRAPPSSSNCKAPATARKVAEPPAHPVGSPPSTRGQKRPSELQLRHSGDRSSKRQQVALSPSIPGAPKKPGPSSRTVRSKARRPARRKKLKDEGAQQSREAPRPEVLKKYVESAAVTASNLNIQSLPTKSSGYEAKSAGSGSKRSWTVERLEREGFMKVAWDGNDTLILTESGTNKIFAVCVGKPKDATWDAACADAGFTMRKCAQHDTFVKKELEHKRGRFPVINAGILHGQGSTGAHNLCVHGHDKTLSALLGSAAIQRIAVHQSESLKLFFPRLYDYYHLRQMGVLAHNPKLRPNFVRSVFACGAFNMGDKVTTCSHRDCMNCPFGQCAVTAFGRYDYTRGGHLVLEEAKLYVEFPPGGLILLPSATVTHANTPIQEGETRQSFTQYTPGGLFRYYDNGFRTELQLFEESQEEYEQVMKQKGARWELGLGLWSTVEELLSGGGPHVGSPGASFELGTEAHPSESVSAPLNRQPAARGF